jgi:Rrf2 family nitric oxide-sensitive transcriptional repressor
MRLTIYTDYALRMLIYLGVNGDGLCSIGTIATSYGISKNHLMKVAIELSSRGVIETVRGNGGGMRLAIPPHRISIGEIVRMTESDMYMAGCFDPDGPACSISSSCLLRGALNDALNAFMGVLDGYTLADIITKKSRIQKLLGIEIVSI